MAEFDDLLAGIRAHPADELRRLVFADWLDENAGGDPLWSPWASYIRWAVSAVRTPRTDPDYWKYRRYPEEPPPGLSRLLGIEGQPGHFEWLCGFPDILSLDVDTLHAHDWRLATLPGPLRRLAVRARNLGTTPDSSVPPVATDWVAGPTVARAGALDVSMHDLDAMAVLNALAARAGSLPPLSLTLSVAAPEVATALTESPFPSLVGLSVYQLSNPEQLAASGNLRGVKSFSASGMPASADRWDRLARALPSLTRLATDGLGRTAFLTALADGHSPHLTHLEMAALTHEVTGWAEFAGSPAFARLERLSWSDSDPDDTAAAVWPAGLPEPEPGAIILNANSLPAGRTAALLASPLLNRCSCLFLNGCGLTADAYLALAENPAARNLNVLSASRPFKSGPIWSGAVRAALCRSPLLAGLTELSLIFHALTDDDFEELLVATFAHNLCYLNLAGSYFSERVLERLTDPDVLPELTWLDIHKPTSGSRRLEPAFQKRFGPNFAF